MKLERKRTNLNFGLLGHDIAQFTYKYQLFKETCLNKSGSTQLPIQWLPLAVLGIRQPWHGTDTRRHLEDMSELRRASYTHAP
jgi:hypothetical protein